MSSGANETLYLVRKGLFLARVEMPKAHHRILSLLYPGDFVRGDAMPPTDGAEIIAASVEGEVWRLRWPVVAGLLDADPKLAHHVANRLADQAARLSLHGAVVANLTGEQRVAALMTELALRFGKPSPAGLVFDMPLSRTDIAQHLALNADTVSRIVSKLRAEGLVVPAGRHRLVCRDLGLLERHCPFASTLKRMHAARLEVTP